MNAKKEYKAENNKIIEPNKQYPFNWDAVLFLIFGFLFMLIVSYLLRLMDPSIISMTPFIKTIMNEFKYLSIIKSICAAFLLVYFLYNNKINTFFASIIYGFLLIMLHIVINLFSFSLFSQKSLFDIVNFILNPSNAPDYLQPNISMFNQILGIKNITYSFIYGFTLLIILKLLFRHSRKLFISTLIAFLGTTLITRIYINIFEIIEKHEFSLSGLSLYNILNPLVIGLFFYLGMYIYTKRLKITEKYQNVQIENTSGEGIKAQIPMQILKWNWGAFFLHWIWGLSNRVYQALLIFIPGVTLIMPFVLANKGNEWAWRNKRWESIEHFQHVQQKWSNWGIVIFFISIILNIIVAHIFY